MQASTPTIKMCIRDSRRRGNPLSDKFHLGILGTAAHKIKPRPGNVFHIAGAGLFKALGHEPIFQVFEEALALLIVLVDVYKRQVVPRAVFIVGVDACIDLHPPLHGKIPANLLAFSTI